MEIVSGNLKEKAISIRVKVPGEAASGHGEAAANYTKNLAKVVKVVTLHKRFSIAAKKPYI